MFTESLKIALDLSLGLATKATVGAGDIKALMLQMEPWGFECELEWWSVSREQSSEDEVISAFLKRDAIIAKLRISRTFDDVETTPEALTVKGIVFERSVEERTLEGVAGAPVLQRRYRIRFADRARVVWRQHFPKSLYVDSTLQALIKDNLPDGMTLSFDWATASTKRAVLGLNLEEGGASFYDYVAWLVDAKGGVLIYDASLDTYALRGAPLPIVSPEVLEFHEVGAITTRLPRVRRATVNVLNAFTDAATKRKAITNQDSIDGVRQDHLIRSPVSASFDDRVTLETARGKQAGAGARIAFRAFPASPIRPSMGVKLADAFSSELYPSGKTYRTTLARIEARAVDENAGDAIGAESNRYNIDYDLELELASEPEARHPDYTLPRWPLVVEGKVVSEAGTATQGTYQSYKDEATSLDQYKVAIPLFDSKKVVTAFEPGLTTGHMYFPVIKDARVLVAIDFDSARILRFLDWRPGARLPLDGQGNHLLVGKGKDDETSIKHDYDDAKPALTILRTKDKDTQTIKISEGTIFLETK